ncbi:XRE family transcriptional regulator [Rhodococcus erythropolis]|uniref:helix-turn-helix domain-containing protein n=1 Tax=Rhodococcus erythropolis TaxID=1833 RepID=UPI001E42C209|nr:MULTISPECIES: XRE family transcriptional regulator [Rhodococcus erythropolis group]MCD2109309.1 XRE family transcriptional regulator [Rhodococcus qingshengii]MCZ4528233.1 XRE family transcriptional regulator [Rhodococcus erythropolis]
MAQFRISLDELERVKRRNRITSQVELASVTGLSRSTWNRAMRDGEPSRQILEALAHLGADPSKVLVLDDLGKERVPA